MKQPVIRQLPRELFPLLDKFYRQHRSTMRNRNAQQAWVAAMGDDWAGALCLHQQENCQWLTGLFIAPEYRGNGLAGELLRQSLAAQDEPVWLFCQPSLSLFYQRNGFTTGEPELPALRQRLQRYRTNKPLLAMCHPKP